MRKRSALQEEIQQSRPFSSLSQEAMLGLFRTADMVTRCFTKVTESHGITKQQYNVLRILRGAGDEGLPTLTIAERMVERTPGITRLIDRLITKGWVCREPVPGDRRRVQCHITKDGLALLTDLQGPITELDGSVLCMLEEAEKLHLIELLDRVRDGLRTKNPDC